MLYDEARQREREFLMLPRDFPKSPEAEPKDKFEVLKIDVSMICLFLKRLFVV